MALCLLLPLQAWAAAPTNDVCSGAELIPWEAVAPGTIYLTAVTDITEATDPGDPTPADACQTNVSRGIWYKFTPRQTAIYTLSTCLEAAPGTTVPDTVMAIFTSDAGCAGPFVQIPTSGDSVGCSDDACGRGDPPLQAAITTKLDADTLYYILAWQYGTDPPAPGNSQIQLQVTRSLPPLNETCAGATEVLLNLPVSGSTIGANNDYQLSGAVSDFKGIGNTPTIASGRDVVYFFTPPASGNYSVKVLSYGLDNNLVLYVATNCPAGASPATLTNCLAAANRTLSGSPEELMCVPLNGNQSIYILVDETDYTMGCNFRLEVTECSREGEPNNFPTNATPFVCGIEGTISNSPARDVDCYFLGTFPVGSRAFVLIDGSAANRKDFDLRLTTATNTLEFDEGDNDFTFGSFSPNIAGTPLPADPVFIRIDYNGSLQSEPYRVYAVVQPSLGKAVPETEPNDLPSEANEAPANYFYGTLAGPAPSTDIDLFRFVAGESELVFISLDGDPLRNNTPINAKLELLDESGSVLAAVNDAGQTSSTSVTANQLNAPTPNSPGEALVYRIMAEGVYYVRVSSGTTSAGTIGAGDYLLSISRKCSASLSLNTPPLLTNTVITTPINENAVATLSGTILDPDPQDPHTVVVNWGDNSPMTTNDLPAGVTSFNVLHQYLDDNPTGTGMDNCPVSVSVLDRVGDSDSTNLTVSVHNVAPAVTSLTLNASTVNEIQLLQLDGTLSDPGTLDAHTVLINWGDGSSNVVNLTLGTRAFTANHRYQDDNPSATTLDNYPINVVVQDDDTGVGFGATNVWVQNAPPTITNLTVTSPILENQSAVLAGSFSDPSVLDTFTLTINWGDGSAPQVVNLPAGSTNFSLSHQYRDDNPTGTLADIYSISLTLLDDDNGSVSTNTSVTVTNVAPTLSNVSVTSPLTENGTATLTGNISDPGTLDTFTLVINWGDGTVPQTNAYPAGASSFSLTHQYLVANTNASVGIVLTDDDTGSDATNASVTIRPRPAGPRFVSYGQTGDHRIRLQLQGTPGATYRMLVSGNLGAWVPLLNGTRTADDVNGYFEVEDDIATPGINKFYRAVWP